MAFLDVIEAFSMDFFFVLDVRYGCAVAPLGYTLLPPLPGKIIDSTGTRAAIGWQPKYKTFGAFIDTLV